MAATSKTTTDHRIIRRPRNAAARAREAPAAATILAHGASTFPATAARIRTFPGKISSRSSRRRLALLYQEETAGGERSNFNKLVSREQ
jgi:hypothetical protein